MDSFRNVFEAETDLEYDESQQTMENTKTEPLTSSGKVDKGLLIEAIQGYPYLFDLSEKLYKDNKKKMLAWQHIAEVVNCTVEDCIKAWRNLRDRFVKERNKLASGAGAPETNWPYYEPMLFYGKFSKPRKTHTTTKSGGSRSPSRLSSESRPSSSASAWSTYETILSSPECVPITDSVQSEEDIQAPGPSKKKTTNTPSVGGTPISSFGHTQKRKRLVAQDYDDVGKLVGVANSIMEKLGTRVPKNTNSTFTDYVYQELEKMTEQEAKKKRKKILEILFDESD